LKILIADDDPVSLRLFQRILQKSGYEVVTARNGSQALMELTSHDGPRLALLDWMMPEMDGLEVCRRVRSGPERPYVYITMLTSKLSSEDVVAGLEAGSDDYITKPCNPEELKARLRTGQRVIRLEDTLVQAREEMRFKATHDALTGLWNHGAILGILRSELNRCALEDAPLSLLLCDLDHFKKVNDVHGHPAGDEVLRQVATRLKGAVRSDDSVGRYGGEEFLIVLRGCPASHISGRAEKVREAVSCRAFPLEDASISMSLSIGALSVGKCDASLPFELLLKNVDGSLYLAKSAGRNCVILSHHDRLKMSDPIGFLPPCTDLSARA
jgi:two-component system, cell cycle response regulator